MRIQKLILFTFIFSLLSIATFAQHDAAATASKDIKPLPATPVKTMSGKSVNLIDYVGSAEKPGKITVISLWATWCVNCLLELDAIAEVYEEWQEDYDMQLIAITIDTRRQLAKAGPLAESRAWEYIILSDANQELKNVLNFQSIPYTLLVDEKGNIVYVHSGYSSGDEYELEDKIKELRAMKK